MPNSQETRFLTGNDKLFFEKALQLYIFFRHVPLQKIPEDLANRFRHDGNVVYSLIIGYFEKNTFSVEYLQFLNNELRKLSQLEKNYFEHFEILPSEIGELELLEKVSLSFTDEESEKVYRFHYYKESGQCDFEILH